MINEIADQLNRIIEALASDLYHPLDSIPLEGFRADRDLSLSEAETVEG